MSQRLLKELEALSLGIDREPEARAAYLDLLTRAEVEVAPALFDEVDFVRHNTRMRPPPQHIVRVASEAALRAELAAAVASRTAHGEAEVPEAGLRALGNGYGFSALNHATGTLAELVPSFEGVLPVAADELIDDDPARLCRFAGGTRIATLDAHLAAAGCALFNAPGYDDLTFVGVMSVGGHGSGLVRGSLSEVVRSLDVMHVDALGQVEVLRVERASRPLTRVGASLGDVRLVHDDALFSACTVGLGNVGVVVAVTIEVAAHYNIEEHRYKVRWEDVPDLVEADLALQRAGKSHSIEVWVNPYASFFGKRTTVLCRRRAVDAPVAGQRARALREGTASGFDVIAQAFRAGPALVPSGLDVALSLTVGSCVLEARHGLGFGSTNLARVRSAAFGVPLAATWSVLERLFAWLEGEADMRVTSPIGLRFIGASDAWMSPAFGRETCMIEVPILVGQSSEMAAKAQRFLEAMLAMFGAEVRPHWGQVHRRELDLALVAKRQGVHALGAFQQAVGHMDRLGVFANPFTAPLYPRDTADPAATHARFAHTESLDQLAAADCHSAELRTYSRLFCDPGVRLSDVTELPRTDAELVALLAGCRDTGRHLTVHGSGHSMHTQALRVDPADDYVACVDDAIVVDPARRTLTAGAGARWSDLVDQAMKHGLLPKVVTTSPLATVGGTLAANSIGQACRRFGHEADGVLALKVALPDDGLGGGPAVVRLDPGRPGDRPLFEAIVRGYGHIGIVLEATYALVPLPPSPMAVTTLEVFDLRYDDLVRRLVPAVDDAQRPIDDGSYKAGLMLLDGAGRWVGRVATTRYETVTSTAGTASLVPYAGPTAARTGVELLLTNMGTTRIANLAAAKATAGSLAPSGLGREATSTPEGKRWVDPVRGHLFTMEGNIRFKEAMPVAFNRLFASTVQHTYVVPVDAAARFLDDAIAMLVIQPPLVDVAGPTAEEVAAVDQEVPDFIAFLAEQERQAIVMSGEIVDESAPPVALALSALKRLIGLETLVPVLFEMIWLPADRHLLSAVHGQPGIAISMTFQGPGIDPRGPIAHWPWIRHLHENLSRAITALAARCVALGGCMSLTKNMFVGTAAPTFVRRMLGSRLEAFEQVRARFDPTGVLRTRYGREVLGLSEASPGPRTWT